MAVFTRETFHSSPQRPDGQSQCGRKASVEGAEKPRACRRLPVQREAARSQPHGGRVGGDEAASDTLITHHYSSWSQLQPRQPSVLHYACHHGTVPPLQPRTSRHRRHRRSIVTAATTTLTTPPDTDRRTASVTAAATT